MLSLRSKLWLMCFCVCLSGCSVLKTEAEHTVLSSSAEASQALPDEPKSHVYIYFIQGIDPLDWANLCSVKSYCQDLGYKKVKLVTYHQGDEVVEAVRDAKGHDPKARILLFGYSAGASSACRVIDKLHEFHAIDVDAVIYTSGILLQDSEYCRPDYVGRIIHILDNDWLIPGTTLTGAENYRLDDVWHFGSPTHPQTKQLLKRELDRLAEEPSPVNSPG